MASGYERQFGAPRPVGLPQASATAFGANVGAAIGDVGDALARARQIERDAAANDQHVQASLGLETLKSETEAFEASMRDGTNPSATPGGFGLHDVTRQFWKERADKLLEGVTDKRVRDNLSVRMAAYDGDLSARLRGAEVAQRGAWVKTSSEQYRTALINRASRTVGRTERGQAFADGIHDIEEYTAGLAGVPAEVAEQVRREMTAQFKGDVGGAWASDDPQAMRAMLASGLFDDVDPDANARILRRVEVAEEGQRIAAERVDRERLAAEKEEEATALGAVSRGEALPPDRLEELAKRAEARGDTSRAGELRATAVSAATNKVYGGGNADAGQMTARRAAIEADPEWRSKPNLVAEHAQLGKLRADLRRAVPEFAPLNMADPAAIDRRKAESDRFAQAHGGERHWFGQDQAEELGRAAQSGAVGRAQVAELLMRVPPSHANVALNEVAKGDLTMRAVLGVRSRKPVLAAQMRAAIFRGEAKAGLNPKLLPAGDVNDAWGEKIQPAIDHLPDEQQSDIKRATGYLYAATAEPGEWSEGAYISAANQILSPDGGGGIGSHRGYPITLPGGMTQRDLDRRWAFLPDTISAVDDRGRIGRARLQSEYHLVPSGKDGTYWLADGRGNFAMAPKGGRYPLNIRAAPASRPMPTKRASVLPGMGAKSMTPVDPGSRPRIAPAARPQAGSNEPGPVLPNFTIVDRPR